MPDSCPSDRFVRRAGQLGAVVDALVPLHQMDEVHQLVAGDAERLADWLLGVNSSYAVCKAVGFGNNSLGTNKFQEIGADK
jgi:hypothetical protein